MVSRTWSVSSKVTIGSSAAVFVVVGGLDRLAELDVPLRRQRHQPGGPGQREQRRDREVRQPEQPGQQLDVGDHRVDLLGPDDRARHDRRLGAQRRRDEPAAAEPLQLVAVLEVLAQALVALGEHRGQLAGGQQPVRVGGAGHGVAGLARRLTDHRHVEHHVGGQQPQVAVGRGACRAPRPTPSARRTAARPRGWRRPAPRRSPAGSRCR